MRCRAGLRGQRQAFGRYDQGDDQLRAIGPLVAAVAVATFVALGQIRGVDLEISAGQIVEQHVEIGVEKIAPSPRSAGRRPGRAGFGPSAFPSGSRAGVRPRTGRVASLATRGRPASRRPIDADDAGEVQTGAAAPPRRRPPRPRSDPRGTRRASGSRPPAGRTPRPPCAKPPPATN